MKITQLPVSRRFYKDLTERIDTALSSTSASVSEAKRIIDAYLNGEEPESSDAMALLAFNVVRVEIDRAMNRSRQARERAVRRRSDHPEEKTAQADIEPSPEEIPDSFLEGKFTPAEAAQIAGRHVSRRERMAALNLVRRLKKPRWGAIA